MDVPADFFDDFKENLHDPDCVQEIYDFCLTQVRGMVEYNDEDDIIQDVFYRLTRWPITATYFSKRHYFSLLKITIRQSIAAYWRRRHSKRNDCTKRKFVSDLEAHGRRCEWSDEKESAKKGQLHRLQIKETVQQVMLKVETLDQRSRILFQLRFLEDESPTAIATRLKISVRTVYRMEAKLRALLQEFIRTHY